VPRTVRLPGMDGGYDLLGDDAPPVEIGRVTWRYRLLADTRPQMEALRDTVKAMVRSGRQQLVMETSGGTQRWTYAKINNVGMPDSVVRRSERVQDVTLDFQVPHPRWFSTAASSPVVQACSGTNTTYTITTGGTAIAKATITVDPGATLTSGVIVQRLVSSVVIDEVDFNASLVASDLLVVDARALSVKKNGADAYGNTFSTKTPGWFRLVPGDNTIKVILVGAETASVSIAWDDTWI
jgi:hypothetical protein